MIACAPSFLRPFSDLFAAILLLCILLVLMTLLAAVWPRDPNYDGRIDQKDDESRP